MASKHQKHALNKQQLIDSKEIEILFDQGWVSILAAQSAAAVFIFAMWGHAPSAILLPWIIFFSLLNLARFLLIRNYLSAGNRHDKYKVWHIRFVIGTTLSGVLWGLLAVLLLPVEDRSYTPLLILVVTGLAGGSIGTYSTSRMAYLTYASASLLPLAFVLCIQEETALKTYGLLVCIYYVLLTVSMFRINKMLRRGISLQFENIDLLNQLKHEKDTIAAINQSLEEDIEKHKGTEKELLTAKNEAESLASTLSKLSVQDALTGIANRRGFDQFLDNAWNRGIRNTSPVSLIFCDVDYFKNYNDHYGHQNGDEVLRKIASTIESRSRKGTDLVARYGGEEFAIILSDTDINEAEIVAEKIRTAIQSLEIPHEKSDVNDYATISLGLATLVPDRQMKSSLLVKQADQCLYSAKKAGRNQLFLKTIK